MRPRIAFTLPEIMFSIFILAVAVVSVMGLLAAGAKRQGYDRDREIAGQLALAIVEAGQPLMMISHVDNDIITQAITDSTISELPNFLAVRLRSNDGSFERAVASGRKVVYMAVPSGTSNGAQLRVIAALDTPLPATVPVYPVPQANHPGELCRTLICWSVDWTQFEDFEENGSGTFVDRNGNGSQQFGHLSKSATLEAAEIARFNLYNPAQGKP